MAGETGSALEQYKRLIQKTDVFCRTVRDDLGPYMACKKGCDSCCRHLSLFTVEAVNLRLSLDRLDPAVQQSIRARAESLLDDPDGPCPMLDGGICPLYEDRPVICRTHGYPILVEDGDGKRVDHCPLNFRESGLVKRNHILDIEVLNMTLSAVNRLFMENDLGDPAFPERLLMAEALLMDIGVDDD